MSGSPEFPGQALGLSKVVSTTPDGYDDETKTPTRQPKTQTPFQLFHPRPGASAKRIPKSERQP